VLNKYLEELLPFLEQLHVEERQEVNYFILLYKEFSLDVDEKNEDEAEQEDV
jgi:hypothetical protein